MISDCKLLKALVDISLNKLKDWWTLIVMLMDVLFWKALDAIIRFEGCVVGFFRTFYQNTVISLLQMASQVSDTGLDADSTELEKDPSTHSFLVLCMARFQVLHWGLLHWTVPETHSLNVVRFWRERLWFFLHLVNYTNYIATSQCVSCSRAFTSLCKNLNVSRCAMHLVIELFVVFSNYWLRSNLVAHTVHIPQ